MLLDHHLEVEVISGLLVVAVVEHTLLLVLVAVVVAALSQLHILVLEQVAHLVFSLMH